MEHYKITQGQLITLWVFGILFVFGDIIYIADQYEPSIFSMLLLLLVPGWLTFYTIGWNAANPSKKWKKFNFWKKFQNKLSSSVKISTSWEGQLEKKQSFVPKKDLKGIHWWLAFFIFTLFISIFMHIWAWMEDIDYMQKSSDFNETIKTIIIVIDILQFGWIAFFVAYTIHAFSNLKTNAVLLWKLYLWLLFVINVINLIFQNTTAEESVKGIGYSIIWFLFLTFSDRVKFNFPLEQQGLTFFDKSLFIGISILPIIMTIFLSFS